MHRISILSNNKLLLLISFLTVVFFLFAFFVAKKEVIFADGVGYFSYPYELLLNKDLSYSSQNSQFFFGVIKTDQYNYNKYPIGTGILLIPALLLGEVANTVVGITDHSIYNRNYQFLVGIVGIFYFIAGMALLKRILRHFYKDKVVNWTILTIAFCTNLFIYASTDASFSHIYSFFAINLFVLYLIKWSKKTDYRNTLYLGFALGLVGLIRPFNLLVVILFLFIPIDKQSLNIASNIKLLLRSKKMLTVILAITLLTMFPQFLYWWSITGNFVIYSYTGETFNLLSPQIFNVLFSSRGVLFWHPVLMISFLGIFFLRKKYSNLSSGILVFTLVNIYLISSWWFWDFGIGFGHRGFTDSLGIMAIPLGAILQKAEHSSLASILLVLLCIGIIANLVQAINYIYK